MLLAVTGDFDLKGIQQFTQITTDVNELQHLHHTIEII